jgi:signal transduction histidine kinase
LEGSWRQTGWQALLRPQDAVWLLLFAALAALSPRRGAAETYLLSFLALVQVLAPRVPALRTARGNLAVILCKLLAGFVLIGLTGGIVSGYALILLLPVVSAATTTGPAATTIITVLACVADLLFLPMAARLGYRLEPGLVRDVVLRTLFLPVVSFLTYTLAKAGRMETLRAQESARHLEEANQRLLLAEESARRAERMAALGQLSAGLAHEIRNPIGTIKASAEMLAKRLSPTDSIGAELAGYISSEVDRTNSLVSRFLDFAKPLAPVFSECELHTVLDQAVRNLEIQHAGAGPTIHRNYDPGLGRVWGDAVLLERLFSNLLQNAIAASPEGGLVTIKTRHLEEGAEVSIIDRGPGIAPELHEKIFNPFFTTRASGTGLGLAIAARIAGEHRATIAVESEPGRGAVFSVTLPYQSSDSSGSTASCL